MVQLKRYFKSAAVHPPVTSGHTSTLCDCPVDNSKRSTMPPTLPDPEALDQMMLLSTGSGVAQPLSPPATDCQAEVIMRAASQIAVGANHPPVLTTVIRAPQQAAISLLSICRDAFAGFDERVDSVRIRSRDCDRNFARRPRWQTVTSQTLPG